MEAVVRNLNETFQATPSAVAEARNKLGQFAAAAGATAPQIDAVRLATSEAMTNSVRHAYEEDAGEIQVSAAVVSGELWILIADHGVGLRPHANRPGLGLGLGLISQVSDDFAIVSRATGGTEVRVRFDLTNDSSAAQSVPAETRRRQPRGRRRVHGFSAAIAMA